MNRIYTPGHIQKNKLLNASKMKLKRGFVTQVLTLAFVLFSILHLVINWRSTKSYFPKKIFLISAAVVLLLSAFLIVVDSTHKDRNDVLIEKLVTAPIGETCVVMGIDISQLKGLIGADDLIVEEQETIESLAERYNITPEKLLVWIVEDQQ